MPYLNWREEKIPMARALGEGVDAQLTLTLSPAQRARLRAELQPILEGSGKELRLDLPEGWTLFWKVRPTESRFLLAHPEDELWVGTAALTADHLRALIEALGGAEIGGPLRLRELGPTSEAGNLALVIDRGGD